MKIESVRRFTGESVEIVDDEGKNVTFTRYNPGAWAERMGMSDEPVLWDDQLKVLEDLYQAYIAKRPWLEPRQEDNNVKSMPPAMIQAGTEALAEHDSRFESAEDAVIRIFLAMVEAYVKHLKS